MRVKVLSMGTATAMSDLLGATGPAAPGSAAEAEGGGASAGAESAGGAGAATLLLTNGGADISLVQSTTDEFLRVGEAINVTLPAWYLWSLLYPTDALPSSVDRLKALVPALTLVALDKQLPIGAEVFPEATWNAAADPWSLQAATGALVLPERTDAIQFQLTITDAKNAAATVTLGAAQLPSAHVFGGELPAKTLLLDTLGAQKRQRVIEGAPIVAGAPLLLGCTDWRADQIVDRLTLDTQIGVGQGMSRFGWYEYPIQGQLLYEVRHGVSFDDPPGFRPEELMPSNPTSALLPLGAYGRVAYESTVPIPATATKMSLYLHVKAYLIADYSGVSDVIQQWYPQGQSILLRDSHDNPSGPFTNYDFTLK